MRFVTNCRGRPSVLKTIGYISCAVSRSSDLTLLLPVRRRIHIYTEFLGDAAMVTDLPWSIGNVLKSGRSAHNHNWRLHRVELHALRCRTRGKDCCILQIGTGKLNKLFSDCLNQPAVQHTIAHLPPRRRRNSAELEHSTPRLLVVKRHQRTLARVMKTCAAITMTTLGTCGMYLPVDSHFPRRRRLKRQDLPRTLVASVTRMVEQTMVGNWSDDDP